MEILNQKDAFRAVATEKLGNLPIDFAEKRAFVDARRNAPEPYSAAGVLLLLSFQSDGAPASRGEYCFQLIKRSARVSQPGDLSCPGGMLSPLVDRLILPFISCGIVPVLSGEALHYVRRRPRAEAEALMIFLTGAVREAWEEIRLSPFNVQFIGPLPCHSLVLFRRIIFPLVGLVKKPPRYRPNHEVERVVEIPLTSFFHEENFARLQIQAEEGVSRTDQSSWDFPCFVQHDGAGGQDILWGATFHIILRFLEILFDFRLPDLAAHRVITKTLGRTYLTGVK